MDTITKEMLRLKKTGKIDGLIGAKEIGRLVDAWNKNVEARMLKDFDNEINARNKYYWKLWKRAIAAIQSGEKLPPKEYRSRSGKFITTINLPKGVK